MIRYLHGYKCIRAFTQRKPLLTLGSLATAATKYTLPIEVRVRLHSIDVLVENFGKNFTEPAK